MWFIFNNGKIFSGKWAAHTMYSNNNVDVFPFWVPCCDVRYDLNIKTMFGSSLPPVVCRSAHVLFTLFVFAYQYGVQYILCCAFGLIFVVLCSTCCQFLWIVHFSLYLRYSLTFINQTGRRVYGIFPIRHTQISKYWKAFGN